MFKLQDNTSNRLVFFHLSIQFPSLPCKQASSSSQRGVMERGTRLKHALAFELYHTHISNCTITKGKIRKLGLQVRYFSYALTIRVIDNRNCNQQDQHSSNSKFCLYNLITIVIFMSRLQDGLNYSSPHLILFYFTQVFSSSQHGLQGKDVDMDVLFPSQ